jgi:hypothetical protein
MEFAPEIVENILLNLSYNDIMSYCRTSIDANKVCQDDTFWKNKLDRDFEKVKKW